MWQKIKRLFARRHPPAVTTLIITEDVFLFPVEVITQPNVEYISIYTLIYPTRHVLNQTGNGVENEV
jgi:hypothetical protein